MWLRGDTRIEVRDNTSLFPPIHPILHKDPGHLLYMENISPWNVQGATRTGEARECEDANDLKYASLMKTAAGSP